MVSFVRVTLLIIALCSVVGVRAAAAQSFASHVDIAAQASVLRVSDPGSTSAGVGGRLTVGLSNRVAIDSEINFYPRDNFVLASSAGIGDLAYDRRRLDGFVGLKVGQRNDRFGVFVKVRPGFTRLIDKGVECTGEVCALILIAPPQYRTELALDLGGIVEYYATARMFARIDLGDVLIRHRSAAPPCARCTTHNLSSRVGVGFRF